ncbi:MAG TPA: hypothetical protein VG838_02270 [Opitutaceae bacterium]|nr:hypothetical protein [Opitutaceae bacterium]
MKNLLLLLCLGIGGYKAYSYWQERSATRENPDAGMSAGAGPSASPAGFVEAFVPEGVNPGVMTVFMPVGCPLEAGRRGRALVEKMQAAHIPVTASSEARLAIQANSQAELDAMLKKSNAVMTGKIPIVFFRGRAKNNPSFEDVLAEYRAAR